MATPSAASNRMSLIRPRVQVGSTAEDSLITGAPLAGRGAGPRSAIGQITGRDYPSCSARLAAARIGQSRRKASSAGCPRFDWRRIAYNALVSRALDDVEETTNKNKATVPREHLVLYQFSARGHDVAQIILGSLIDHPHDAASAYYRSRPLLLALGLVASTTRSAVRSGAPAGSATVATSASSATCPNRDGPVVLPMSGDVGSQYTPCAGWAQSIQYHADVLERRRVEGRDRRRARRRSVGGDERLLVGAHDGDDAQAADALLHRRQRARHLGARRHADAGRRHREEPRVVRESVHSQWRRHAIPRESARCSPSASSTCAAATGPALVRLTVPRLSSHSGPDNQKGYRTDAEIAADTARDPLPEAARASRAGAACPTSEWTELEAEVARDVQTGARRRARAPESRSGDGRSASSTRTTRADVDAEAFGGLSRDERAALGGTETPPTTATSCASPKPCDGRCVTSSR